MTELDYNLMEQQIERLSQENSELLSQIREFIEMTKVQAEVIDRLQKTGEKVNNQTYARFLATGR